MLNNFDSRDDFHTCVNETSHHSANLTLRQKIRFVRDVALELRDVHNIEEKSTLVYRNMRSMNFLVIDHKLK